MESWQSGIDIVEAGDVSDTGRGEVRLGALGVLVEMEQQGSGSHLVELPGQGLDRGSAGNGQGLHEGLSLIHI